MRGKIRMRRSGPSGSAWFWEFDSAAGTGSHREAGASSKFGEVKEAMTSQAANKKGQMHLAMVFVLLAAGIGIAGRLYYLNQRDHLREVRQREFTAIADLKSHEISRWRNERLADAKVLKSNPLFMDEIGTYISGEESAGQKERLTAWLNSWVGDYDYSSVALIDSEFRILISVPPDKARIGVKGREILEEVEEARQPLLSDLHYSEVSKAPEIDLVLPILSSENSTSSPIAYLFFRIDPEKFLFPLIASWPVPSETAESLIARREGHEVVYLSQLRHISKKPLEHRVPITQADLPIVKAAMGERGVVEGIDYRGKPVVAVLRAVPGSTWLLLAKVDKDEIYRPIQRYARFVMLLVGCMIVTAGVGLGAVWRGQTSRLYRRQFETEHERLLLLQRHEQILKQAQDIIILIDAQGRIAETNDRVEKVYGYSRAELIGKDVRELRPPELRAQLDERLRAVEESGSLLYETVHQRKNGSTFPLEVSLQVLRLDGEKFYQGIFRDITDRKRAEARIERLNQLLRMLSDANQLIVRTPDREKLLGGLCQTIVDRGGFQLAWIALGNPDGGPLAPAACAGSGAIEELERIREQLGSPAGCRGPAAQAVREGVPVICNEIKEECSGCECPIAEETGVRAVAALPLLQGSRVAGVLCVNSSKPNEFDEEMLHLLLELAQDISYALQNLDNAAQRRRAEEDLRKSEEIYRRAIAASHAVAYRRNFITREFDFMSEGIEPLTGYPARDFTHHLWDRIIIETVMRGELEGLSQAEAVKRTLAGAVPEWRADYRVRTRDGRERWLSDSSVTIKNDEGLPIASLGILEDITDRKQVEERIRESEEKYRAVVENASEAIFVTQDGYIRFANRAACSISQYSMDELRSRPLVDFAHPEDREKVLQRSKRRLGGEKSQGPEDARLIAKDGSVRWLEVNAVLIEWDGRPATLNFAGDVTERRRAEEALRDREARLSSVLATAPVGIGIVSDRNIVQVNQRICEMTGYAPEELIGQSARMLYLSDEEYEKAGRDRYAQIRENGQGSVETRWKRKDGTVTDILLSSSPVDRSDWSKGITFTALDITERKRAEARIRQSEDTYRRAIAASRAYAYRRDYGQPGFVFIDEGIEQVMGVPAAELTTQVWASLIQETVMMGEAAGLTMEEAVERARDGRLKDWRADYRIRSRSGEERWLADSSIQIKDESGRTIGALGILQDITERKRVEKALRLQNERLDLLNHAAQIASSANSAEALCEGLLGLLRGTMPCDAFFVDIYDPDRNEMIGIKGYDTIGGVFQPVGLPNAPMNPSGQLYQTVFVERKTHCIFRNKPQKDGASFVAFGDTSRRSASLVFVPLVAGDRVMAMLSVQSYAPNAYSEQHIELLDTVARRIGPALDSIMLSTRLRESEERLRTLINAMPDIVCFKDAEGRCLESNDFTLRLFGLESTRYRGMKSEDLAKLSPQIGNFFLECDAMRQADWDSGLPVRFDQPIPRPGMTPLVFDVIKVPMLHEDGKRKGLVIVGRDITERKRVEEERARLATAIEQAAESILILDLDGRVQYANPAFERSTGYTREEILGRTQEMLSSGRHDPEFFARIWESLRRGEMWHGRIVNRRKDGNLIEEESTITPVRDASGAIIHYVEVKRDVTRDIAIEAQMRQMQRFESIGTLASGIAHEINNPINAAMNYAQIIADEMEPGSRLGGFAGEIVHECDRVAAIVRNLIAFSRHEKQSRSAARISDIIESTLSMARTALRHDQIALKVDVPESLPQIRCSTQQIQQVLISLITNSREALNLRFPEGSPEKSIQISGCTLKKDEADYLRITIEDHGVGIAPEVRERIFDPFFTTKTRDQGMGLGLAISHSIVRDHGGTIQVESEPGKFTRFYVDLPIDNGEENGA